MTLWIAEGYAASVRHQLSHPVSIMSSPGKYVGLSLTRRIIMTAKLQNLISRQQQGMSELRADVRDLANTVVDWIASVTKSRIWLCGRED